MLEKLNGTPELDKCIREVFAPVNFVGNIPKLDEHIKSFNQHLVFDKWRIARKNAEIIFQKLEQIEIDETVPVDTENDFLEREFKEVKFSGMGFEGAVEDILQQRITEIEKCFASGSPLAVILLAGSTLEGVLLGIATRHPMQFNLAKASPKDTAGKVLQFHKWTLSNFIDVAKELALIQQDTYKFSHALRDFRNYIHPFEQMSSGFTPREHTAKICLQVLRAGISELRVSAYSLQKSNQKEPTI
jgi:hypothetical protein